MHFKLLVVFVEDSKTDAVMSAARESGATGCTVINHARGEGLEKHKSFFGLTLSGQRDVLLMRICSPAHAVSARHRLPGFWPRH